MKEKVIADITTLGPDWAHGCDQCSYGIVASPPIAGLAEIYLERLAQAINGDIEFCTCKAGARYRVGLLNRRQQLLEEAKRVAKKNPMMAQHAANRTHPDIERVLAVYREQQDALQPTFHFEGEPA